MSATVSMEAVSFAQVRSPIRGGTGHEKIMVLKGAECHPPALNDQIDGLLEIARTYDAAAIKRKLQEIVPDYSPQF